MGSCSRRSNDTAQLATLLSRRRRQLCTLGRLALLLRLLLLMQSFRSAPVSSAGSVQTHLHLLPFVPAPQEVTGTYSQFYFSHLSTQRHALHLKPSQGLLDIRRSSEKNTSHFNPPHTHTYLNSKLTMRMKQRNYHLSAHTTQGRKLNAEYTAGRHLQVHHKAKDSE